MADEASPPAEPATTPGAAVAGPGGGTGPDVPPGPEARPVAGDVDVTFDVGLAAAVHDAGERPRPERSYAARHSRDDGEDAVVRDPRPDRRRRASAEQPSHATGTIIVEGGGDQEPRPAGRLRQSAIVAGTAILVGAVVLAVTLLGRPGPAAPALIAPPTSAPASTTAYVLPEPAPSTGSPTPSPSATASPTPAPARTPTHPPARPSTPTPTPTPTPTATPTPPPTDLVGPLASAVTGRCADARANDTYDGNAIQSSWCDGTQSQQWTIATDGTMRVLGRCLQTDGGSLVPGTPVVMWTCDGSPAQQWRVAGGGLIVQPASGLCLEVPGASMKTVQLEAATCAGTTGQQWTAP